jgi:hypothetical protein
MATGSMSEATFRVMAKTSRTSGLICVDETNRRRRAQRWADKLVESDAVTEVIVETREKDVTRCVRMK